MNEVLFASQGVRILATPASPTRNNVIEAGKEINTISNIDDSTTLRIPTGCIGVIHRDVGKEMTISIIRDDCKAARKAIKNDVERIEREREMSLEVVEELEAVKNGGAKRQIREISEEEKRITRQALLNAGDYDTCIADIFYAVEATSCEKHFLWKEYNVKHAWKDIGFGWGMHVGELDSMPIVVSLQMAIIDGRRILFYEATSQIVDHRIISKWLNDNVPALKHIEGVRRKMCDATNFHNCLHSIAEANKKED